jgi:hypothetical protein
VKHRLIIICMCLGVLGMAPAMFADVTDYLLNLNGTSYCPGSSSVAACSSNGGLAAVPGLSSTLDTSSGGTGLGTLTLTYNPGAGSYNVGFWIFEQLQQPGYNEYGSTGGTPGAQQTWQIDVPDYDYAGELGTSGAGTIIANTLANTLADTNYIPGSDSSYAGGGFCATFPDPTCNDYTSVAMFFGFTLAAGQEEALTFNVSTTAPTTGFYMEQIHPVDGANNSETDYFFSGTASAQPIGTSTPEPGTGILVGVLLALALSPFGRRLRNRIG